MESDKEGSSAERDEQEQTKGSSAEVDNYGNISNLKDIFYQCTIVIPLTII